MITISRAVTHPVPPQAERPSLILREGIEPWELDSSSPPLNIRGGGLAKALVGELLKM